MRYANWVAVAVVVLTALSGCDKGKAPADEAGSSSASAPAAAQSGAATPLEVQTTAVSALAIFPERSAPAEVVSAHESRLSSEISARIVALPVDVGQSVAAGAVVVRLDAEDARLELQRVDAEIARAQARLSQARANLERFRKLREENFIAAEALNQRETEVAVAEADAKALAAGREAVRRTMSKAEIRAPFPAIVRERHAQLGELAAPGTPLLTLVDRSRVEVSAAVQPQDVASLRASKDMEFVGLSGSAKLSVLRVSPVVDRQARSVEARLRIAGESLPPGLEGRVVWRDTQPHLPPQYLSRRGGVLGVFVVEAGRVRFVPLPGAEEGRPAALPLLPDAAVVTTGWQGLQDGQTVTVRAR